MAKHDRLGSKHIAEGRYEEVMTNRAVFDRPGGSPPHYVRVIILEVISDPATLDKTKLSHYEHDLGVSNVGYASVAPRNSIIGRPVTGPTSGASQKAMVFYPFFPPHMSMPAKAGEHVWAMFENPDAKSNDIGYWMCKIVQPNFVEDVNYTHADRQFDPSFSPGIAAQSSGDDSAVYEFRNGAVDSKDGQRFSIPETASSPDGETAYADLLTKSDASKITKFEPVPRYRKRPADTAFEGSNNTLIVLGTDRTGPISDYDADPSRGQVPKPLSDDIFDEGAGSIDIVAGRGQTAATGGTPVDNKLLGKEVAKDKKGIAPKEGDVDLVNDRSRALVSQKTKVDINLKIDSVVQAHTSASPVKDGAGEGAIVIKTDKVRIVARHDVVFLVTGATETDANGNVKDPGADGSLDPSKCASIILRANGDIIFTPSDKGLIMLGGDDADTAILGVDKADGAVAVGGQVTAPGGIMSTMGGFLGIGGAQGKFLKKVLGK